MPADGRAGGLYVIGDFPNQNDVAAGRPFSGGTGRLIRPAVTKLWKGDVAFDSALRCAPGRTGIEESMVDACRGYLAGVLRQVRPQRILALGGWAAMAVLGRSPAPFSTRRAFSWLFSDGQDPVPVFMMMGPGYGTRNRFVQKWWNDDLAWALTAEPPFPPVWQDGEIRLVTTLAEAEEAVTSLRAAPWFAFDAETSGRMFEDEFTVLSVAATTKGSDVAWFWDAVALADPAIVSVFKLLMEDHTVKKVGQNIKYDMLALRRGLGIVLRGFHGDTRLWRKLEDPDAAGDLATLNELVGMGGHKDEAEEYLAKSRRALAKAHRGYKKNPDELSLLAVDLINRAQVPLVDYRNGTTIPREGIIDPAIETAVRLGADPLKYIYALLPYDIIARYNARDSIATARLGELLEDRISKEPDLQRTWDTLIKPATDAVALVEYTGIAVDVPAIEAFRDHLALQLLDVTSRLDKYGTFNPASVPQVRKLLFETLHLTPPKTTDSGLASTDNESLESIQHQHPVVGDLIAYRKITKLKGTYADGMLEHVTSDHRIHPTLNLDGARSGRLSCSDPNLQNVPRGESIEGAMARNCFVAPLGSTLLQADYSQLEIRIAAMLSGDEVMIEILRSGHDFHQRTAEFIAPIVWGIKAHQVTKKHRSAAKAFVFGVLYGMSDAGVASRAGCSLEEAGKIREAILGRFRKLAKYCQEQLAYARKHGFAWTWWDGHQARRRPLWHIGDSDADGALRSVAEHSSWNTPIQGTASDFCLASLIAVQQWIEEDVVPAKLVLTVHDSLMLEVVDSALPEVAFQLRRIMTSWNSLGVPITVDLESGRAWGSMQPFATPPGWDGSAEALHAWQVEEKLAGHGKS